MTVMVTAEEFVEPGAKLGVNPATGKIRQLRDGDTDFGPAKTAIEAGRTYDLADISYSTRTSGGHLNAFDHPIPDAAVWLIVWPSDRRVTAEFDRDRAHEFARNIGGVVAKLPIVGDYRQETT